MEAKKLGFGCMRLPISDKTDQASFDSQTLNKMVDTFIERGFTYFDTAYMYHAYKSEIAAREALVKRHNRNAYTLATKLPTVFLKTEEDMERIFNEQMTKCGVDYFDYYLIHNLNVHTYETAQRLDCFSFILQKKKEGKIKKVGFSYHDNAQLLDEILTSHPEMEFVQIQLNYLDWDSKTIQSGACYDVAKKHNKPVVVMEPVKGGALANVPAEVEKLFKDYNSDMSVASWAIRFAVSHDNVMMVLSGMSDYKQLDDNTSYMKNFKPFNAEEYDIVKKAADIMNSSIDIPCTSCEYCTEKCPKNIAIPKYFELYNAKNKVVYKHLTPQNIYYNNYIKTYGKASDCIECGQCETACPQHLKIIQHLKAVVKSFENK